MDLSSDHLIELAHTTMPFGKYAGRRLINLPVPYLIQQSQNGFPENHLGDLMALALFIQAEGLTYLLDPITKAIAPSSETIQ